jgi:hypothetical protein
MTDTHNTPARPYRDWLPALAALILGLVILYVPALFTAIWVRDFDFPTHLSWASALPTAQFSPGGMLVNGEFRPTPVFQILSAGLSVLPGFDMQRAGLAVSLLADIATGVIVFAGLAAVLPANWRGRQWVATGFAMVLMLVGPVTLISWDEPALYWGYVVPHSYHNPTTILLKPFTLLIFWLTVRVFTLPEPSQRAGWWTVGAATGLVIVSTYTKPNFIICTLPVLGLALVLQLLRRRPVDWRLAIVGIIGPAVLVLAAQYLFRFGSEDLNRLIIAPFEALRANGAQHILPKTALSAIFPAVVYGLYWRRATRDWAFNLAWGMFLVSLPYTFLLAETARMGDVNFGWGSQVTLFVLFVAATIFWLRMLAAARRPMWQTAGIGLVLAVHFICGVVWYYGELVYPFAWW